MKLNQIPMEYRRAAKCALALGATINRCDADNGLTVAFDGDITSFEFDPELRTMHALELINMARKRGFVQMTSDLAAVRVPYVIRTVFSAKDVRVQIGASKWFVAEFPDTASAIRRAIVDAFCAYYDEAIAPYSEA
jgi:hypothetical protein